jgi:hypothetical protein
MPRPPVVVKCAVCGKRRRQGYPMHLKGDRWLCRVHWRESFQSASTASASADDGERSHESPSQ